MSSTYKRSKEDSELISNLIKTNYRLESKIREQNRHLVEARRNLKWFFAFWEKANESETDYKDLVFFGAIKGFQSIKDKYNKIIKKLSNYKYTK
jgi:hypothetical protein